MNLTRSHSRRVLLPAAFLLPFALLLCVFAVTGLAPFGGATLQIADAKGQYVSFFALYQDLLSGKADWLYSFEMLLGDSLSGLFAYYLASPFNLILMLFPREQLPLALNWLVLLKMSACGLTMALYLDGTRGLRPWSLVFTTAYALCGYNNAYAWCIMWLDAVVMLPLVALGIFPCCISCGGSLQTPRPFPVSRGKSWGAFCLPPCWPAGCRRPCCCRLCCPCGAGSPARSMGI